MIDKYRDVPRHSLAKAREIGHKYYWSDEPCKHGHVFYRLTKNHQCVMCRKQYHSTWSINRRVARESEVSTVNGALRRKIEDKLEELRLCKLTDY